LVEEINSLSGIYRRCPVVTIVERKSNKFSLMRKVGNKTAELATN